MIELPEGFRTHLPPRVVDSGRIFRDITGLENIFDTKGSGAGPEMLRTEMGVMYGFDLQPVLNRQQSVDDAVGVAVVVGAASTDVTTTVSFASDHIIKSVVFRGTANPANVDWIALSLQPFGDPSGAQIAAATSADRVQLAPAADSFDLAVGRQNFPIRMHRPTDYSVRVRSNAGGGCTVLAEFIVELLPDGTGW